MRITAATVSGRSSRLLTTSELSVAGVLVTTVRISAEQLIGQIATKAGHDVAAWMDRVPSGWLVDLVLGCLSGLQVVAGGLPTGPLDLLVTAVVPVGGSAWAGIVPLGTTVRLVRAAAGLLTRAAGNPALRPQALLLRAAVLGATAVPSPATVSSPVLPASRNVRKPRPCQAGNVGFSVVIVDDNATFRDIARMLLERGGARVVAVAGTASEAMAKVDELDPDVVLVDIHLGTESGFDLARQLSRGADRAVVLMSTHAEAEFADLIEASPAAGFVPKERLSVDEVLQRVARVSR